MSEHTAHGQIKRATVSAVVTRADGTVEDLGVVADTEYDTPTTEGDPMIQSKERKTLGELSAEPGRHAQELFDAWPTDHLQGLLDWLSQQNVDANVMAHTEIRDRVEADADRNHPYAKRALGKD